MPLGDVGDDSRLTLVRRLFAAISARDVERVGALLDDDVEMRMPFQPRGWPDGARGRAGVLAFWRLAEQNFAPFVLTVDEWWPFEDTPGLAVRYSSRATVIGTGRPYHNRYVGIFQLADGRLARWTEFHDPVVLAEALRAPAGPEHPYGSAGS